MVAVPTVNDYKYAWLVTRTGMSKKSVSDMELVYYSGLSGLLPTTKFSLADHKFTYLKAQTGLVNKSKNDMWMIFLTIYPGSLDDKLFNYYKAG
jgi:hypothetical protein